MFIFWNENSPQTSLMLCISVVLVLVLLWYISKQEYLNACDRRIYDMHYQMHINRGDVPRRDLSKYQSARQRKEHMTGNCGTMLEKHKKDVLNPEKRIMDEHRAGKALEDKIKKVDDPLNLDELPVTQNETTDQQLKRSLTTADYDGPQLEGMSAPVDEFEREYMNRQDQKHQEIYGEQAHLPSRADSLSVLNM